MAAPESEPEQRDAAPPSEAMEHGAERRLLLELAHAGDAVVCPRCLRVVGREHVQCSSCHVLLVEPDLEVACPACGAAASFVVEKCERCGAALRAPAVLEALYPRGVTEPARAPLTEPRDAAPRVHRAPPALQAPPALRAGLFCPRCRAAYPDDLRFCVNCGVSLVTAEHRVRCFRCRAENTIGSDRCWRCHNAMHAGEGSPGPGAPPAVRVRVSRARSTESCSSSIVAMLAALTSALLAVALLWP